MPEKLIPREVLGRVDARAFVSLSEPDDLDALSAGSRSDDLRADLDRERPDGRSFSGGGLSFLAFGGGGVAPQKPHDADPVSRWTLGRSLVLDDLSGGGVGNLAGVSSKSSRSSTSLDLDLEVVLDETFLSLSLEEDFLSLEETGISSKSSAPGKPPGNGDTGERSVEVGEDETFFSLDDEDALVVEVAVATVLFFSFSSFLSLEDDFSVSTTMMGSGVGALSLDDDFLPLLVTGRSAALDSSSARMRSWMEELFAVLDLVVPIGTSVS